MKWTSDRPTVEGWYWWRNRSSLSYRGDRLMVKVSEACPCIGAPTALVAILNGEIMAYGGDPGNEWSGPIPPPED